MTTYTVDGFRFDSIIEARAFAVRMLSRKSVGSDVRITVDGFIEGFVTKKEEGWKYTSHGKSSWISPEGTILRSAPASRPTAATPRPTARFTSSSAKPRPATHKSSQGVDIKRLEDDLMEFYCKHTDLAGPAEYGNRTNLRKMVHSELTDDKHPDPYHLWCLFANMLVWDEYPKTTYSGFTDARLKRMLTDLRILVHKHTKNERDLKWVDNTYKIVMANEPLSIGRL